MVKPVVYKILFVSWMVFVTFSSLFSIDTNHTSRFNIPNADKIVHFLFYFGVVTLGFLATRNNSKGKDLKPSSNLLVYLVIFAILYGITIEFLQHFFTDDRHGDILDALANSAGAIMGMFAVKALFLKRFSLK